VEGKHALLLASNRQLEEREKYISKKLIESEASVARLELSCESFRSDLENHSKSHRVEKRKIETEIILPLKDEVIVLFISTLLLLLLSHICIYMFSMLLKKKT
jgi:hypothetical protein